MDHRNDHHDDSEEIKRWQRIEQPPWDSVVVDEHVDQFSSTENPPTPSQFSSTENPPTPTHHHEGSSETVPITTATGTSSQSAESAISVSGETPPPPSDWRVRVANEGKKQLKLRLGAVRNGIVGAAYRVRECAVCVGAFWSVTCVAGAAAAAVVLVAVVYVRIQRRRRRKVGDRQSVEHLVHLLRKKDEKIRELLLQIAELNKVLSSRRKVPVLRITSC